MINIRRHIRLIHFIFQDFINFSYSKWSWLIHVPIIAVTFLLCNINVQEIISEKLNFYLYSKINLGIDFEMSKDLMDKRIINISTIFSIAFVIIGFLLNSIKKYSEDTYNMIYKNIKLFPVLYTTLSVIAFMIIATTLRNFVNKETFYNIFLWSTTLIIIIIFLIGVLFEKVIFQLKPENVYQKWYFTEISRIAIQLENKYKTKTNRERLNEMRISLEEKLRIASIDSDLDALKNILNVYEKICSLDF